MSFHKRYYNWEKIIENLESNDFCTFDNWIFKPEAHVLQDKESNDFFKAYCNLNEENRGYLFDCIKSEPSEFYMDVIKYIKVVSEEKNLDIHMDPIESYKDLFINKWPELSEKYKNLIENSLWKNNQ
jgi:lipid II:glycine glycyltransferase (peptidoglycan interpeptide bridge formation enzyme)